MIFYKEDIIPGWGAVLNHTDTTITFTIFKQSDSNPRAVSFTNLKDAYDNIVVDGSFSYAQFKIMLDWINEHLKVTIT